MTRLLVLSGLVLTLALPLSPAGADPDQRWLHIRVEEGGEDGERVFVNLPLQVVHEMLPLIEADNLRQGKIDLEVEELDVQDLRRLWSTLRDAPDGEYITVEGQEHVRIAKEGEHLVVRVDEEDEKVDLRVRTSVVDALFSGEGDQLDLVAALKALGQEPECELLTVREGDEFVRIWIDARSSAE